MDVENALSERGGAARWKDLDALGIARSSLNCALLEGRAQRVHRGCYALPGAPRLDVLATVFRATATCLSWCERVGLPLEKPPETFHLGVPQSRAIGDPRNRPVLAVTLHRHGSFHDDFPLAHLDMAALCSTPLAQLALIDAALYRGLVRNSDLNMLQHGDRRRRDWLRAHADARAGSLAETYARVVLAAAGLDVVPQARIGAIGAVDLLVEGVVVVEIDGYAHHSDRAQFEADRRRDRDLHLAGFTPARFTYHDVIARAPEMVSDVISLVWRALDSRIDRQLAGAGRPASEPASGPQAPPLRTRLNAAARVSDRFWLR
ncbi:MAG: type IV toxin-antitoxin system AbiEi family antitoxin domain-containing protein [Demequinaceae bacterium]|nr:type IV toxin-antitoxin system AbiEi family antitoxin domain-containing protein [Demequinaceae bacterium]